MVLMWDSRMKNIIKYSFSIGIFIVYVHKQPANQHPSSNPAQANRIIHIFALGDIVHSKWWRWWRRRTTTTMMIRDMALTCVAAFRDHTECLIWCLCHSKASDDMPAMSQGTSIGPHITGQPETYIYNIYRLLSFRWICYNCVKIITYIRWGGGQPNDLCARITARKIESMQMNVPLDQFRMDYGRGGKCVNKCHWLRVASNFFFYIYTFPVGEFSRIDLCNKFMEVQRRNAFSTFHLEHDRLDSMWILLSIIMKTFYD